MVMDVMEDAWKEPGPITSTLVAVRDRMMNGQGSQDPSSLHTSI
jgi:hypothetical protein